jgi:hypothetical protein
VRFLLEDGGQHRAGQVPALAPRRRGAPARLATATRLTRAPPAATAHLPR